MHYYIFKWSSKSTGQWLSIFGHRLSAKYIVDGYKMLLLMKLSLAACFALLITVPPGFGLFEEFVTEVIVKDVCDALNSSRLELPMNRILEKHPILKNDTDSCKKRLTAYPQYSICINETVIWILIYIITFYRNLKIR